MWQFFRRGSSQRWVSRRGWNSDCLALLVVISVTPYSSSADNIFKIAKTADEVGLEIIGIQDHPYNGSFLDTWTLISALAASTRKIRYFPDVSDLPMRAPAILAKSVATLDILTKGRIELGLGIGAFWDAI